MTAVRQAGEPRRHVVTATVATAVATVGGGAVARADVASARLAGLGLLAGAGYLPTSSRGRRGRPRRGDSQRSCAAPMGHVAPA